MSVVLRAALVAALAVAGTVQDRPSTSPVPASTPGASAGASAGATTGATMGDAAAELARLTAALEAERARVRALEERVRELQRELERSVEERVAREAEWLRYTRAIAALAPRGLVPPAFALAVDDGAAGDDGAADEEAALRDARLVARRARDEEVTRALRALMVVEGVHGLDLLEAGTLLEGGGMGPVVLRVLDERGRPLGSLAAERLRFAGSRAARTLTWILENGRETRLGVATPFAPPSDPTSSAASERRLVFPYVDPAPWLEAAPELFETGGARSPIDPPIDDGRWSLPVLRASLNDLLQLDAALGWYRVRALGGVQDDVLRDVQLERLDADGRVERRLFADRMRVVEQERGLLLLLEDGAQVRGERKTPFLEGRYPIYLPRADVARWRAAGVPGLTPGIEEAGEGGSDKKEH